MRIESLEVFADTSNFAVVKPPGRKYPGSVIQGDSLQILFGLAHHVALGIKGGSPDEECLAALDELHESLLGRLLHYQEVLAQHGIQLPYDRPATERDALKLVPEEPL